MFPKDPAAIIDEQLRVVQRPRGMRPTFAHPHHHVRAGLTRRLAQRIGGWTGNLHGIFKQLRAPLQAFGRQHRMEVEPDRMRWNEAFGEADDVGAVLAGFSNESARFFHRGLTIQKDRCGLYGGHTELRIEITHYFLLHKSNFAFSLT